MKIYFDIFLGNHRKWNWKISMINELKKKFEPNPRNPVAGNNLIEDTANALTIIYVYRYIVARWRGSLHRQPYKYARIKLLASAAATRNFPRSISDKRKFARGSTWTRNLFLTNNELHRNSLGHRDSLDVINKKKNFRSDCATLALIAWW